MTILCETRTYSEKSITHEHSFCQLILPIQGKLLMKTPKYELELDQNHVCFLPSKCIHSYQALNRNELLVLDIPIELGQVIRSENSDAECYTIMNDKWKALRFLLLEEMKAQNKSTLYNLTNYAIDLLNENRTSPSIQYIHENLDKNLPLSHLAAIEKYNDSYYIEWFRKKTGTTPNEYIRTLRLEKAKHYLEETDNSLLMIAESLGYEQQSSFTRVFRQYLNMSPSEYRKEIRKKDKNK